MRATTVSSEARTSVDWVTPETYSVTVVTPAVSVPVLVQIPPVAGTVDVRLESRTPARSLQDPRPVIALAEVDTA